MNSQSIVDELEAKADFNRAENSQRFFKTSDGQYGEGDIFIGVNMPDQRIIAKKYKELRFPELKELFLSPVHEHRMTANLILLYKELNQEVYEFYLDILKNYTTSQIAPSFGVIGPRSGVDNWDLVDASTHKIIGKYIGHNGPSQVLYDLAASSQLWQNRSAIVSTWWLIAKRNRLDETFELAEIFLTHKHDLMHKATGWMLREAGKKDELRLRQFIDENIALIPRTMLRYSIERLDARDRKKYLSIKV
ncbi:DNA alkylation repair protein [Candidatus Saccharibacteria bacterium]|jgi:3-methyladenine DNA glycosylase AlkD|nr:DNA alkylation repair protein [Candidatus Saccharibacteria bacterium]MBP9132202.1 DNA alkylation repair protein [Candidatus Saccharibacteria bacterium]